MIHSILFGNPEDIDRKFSFRSILLRFLQSILNRNFPPQRSPKVFLGVVIDSCTRIRFGFFLPVNFVFSNCAGVPF
ncbi:hypothetical protein LEP1GSC165_0621 [Leptospira santarosai str. CBC523]|nr:hypothetical protein LEP1GSC165_0621 [Leptospira santarosai str. CBC523]